MRLAHHGLFYTGTYGYNRAPALIQRMGDIERFSNALLATDAALSRNIRVLFPRGYVLNNGDRLIVYPQLEKGSVAGLNLYSIVAELPPMWRSKEKVPEFANKLVQASILETLREQGIGRSKISQHTILVNNAFQIVLFLGPNLPEPRRSAWQPAPTTVPLLTPLSLCSHKGR